MATAAVAAAGRMIWGAVVATPLLLMVNDKQLGLNTGLKNAPVYGLKKSDVVLVKKWGGRIHETGTLVAFDWPFSDFQTGIGRVAAEPGDFYPLRGGKGFHHVQDGQVCLRGSSSHESWFRERRGMDTTGLRGPLEEGEDEKSYDSDDFGPLSMFLLQGQVVAVVWPPWRMQMLK
jgi:hypothetical protein